MTSQWEWLIIPLHPIKMLVLYLTKKHAVPTYAGSISSFRFVFFDLKNEWPCLCSRNMQNLTGIFSIWESDDPSRRILGQNPTTWVIRFSNTSMGYIVSVRRMMMYSVLSTLAASTEGTLTGLYSIYPDKEIHTWYRIGANGFLS